MDEVKDGEEGEESWGGESGSGEGDMGGGEGGKWEWRGQERMGGKIGRD